jgi:hypothetical protein
MFLSVHHPPGHPLQRVTTSWYASHLYRTPSKPCFPVYWQIRRGFLPVRHTNIEVGSSKLQPIWHLLAQWDEVFWWWPWVGKLGAKRMNFVWSLQIWNKMSLWHHIQWQKWSSTILWFHRTSGSSRHNTCSHHGERWWWVHLTWVHCSLLNCCRSASKQRWLLHIWPTVSIWDTVIWRVIWWTVDSRGSGHQLHQRVSGHHVVTVIASCKLPTAWLSLIWGTCWSHRRRLWDWSWTGCR